MNSVHESCRVGRRFGRVLSGVLLVSVLGATSLAEDRYLVTRDGEKVRLIRSESEVAVTLRDSSELGAAAKRLAAAGRGVITDLPWAPGARIKLLRVAETSPTRRNLIRQDPAVAEVFPVYRVEASDAPMISTGTITVKLCEGLGDGEFSRLLGDYRLTLVEPVGGVPGAYLVRPADADDDEVLRAEALALDRRTVWAQPNLRRPQRLRQAAPADEFYARQWHLNNTGQEGGLPGADISAPEAWVLGGEGQDILIGMFDDSCDVDHEDLRGNYIGIGNDPSVASTAAGFDDPRPKSIGDQHGTAVMGLAVARANSLGGRGVAYLSRFTASRGLGPLSDAQIANAYLFARQQEVDVHINSWGIPGGVPNPPILEDALEIAFIEGRDLDGEEGTDPPRGMVVVFASGNEGVLVEAGRELSTLPTVIGVGASNHLDQLSSYSNYGPEVDVLAPGGDSFGASAVGLTTTDNDDSAGYVDDGYNVGGFDDFTGEPDIDPDGLYTGNFFGTSAACPVAAGVAAMLLSVNPLLTATDVRLILEHTADKINRGDADYDQTTSRSRRYGYGRINAEAAVDQAQESLTNGGRTWPERPARVEVNALMNRVTWLQNGDPLEFREEEEDGDQPSGGADVLRTTDEFLVIGSDSPFDFIPEDGKCYDPEQIGCAEGIIEPLPSNVEVLAVGCGLACGVDAEALCEAGAEQCVEFLQPSGNKYVAIYARNILGRYSFGVSADTDGNVVDGGELPPRSAGAGGGAAIIVDPSLGAKVTINVSPLEGPSPLTVQFRGNASSVLPIDDSRTAWDFDIDDEDPVDATTRNAEHTYVVTGGGAKTFIARLTMYDNEGNVGFAQTAIRVTGSGTGIDDGVEDASLRIIIGIPGTVGSDVDEGTSPFRVELSIDASALVGTVQSVSWDLGDGTIANSLFVTHEYVNNAGVSLRLPITASVTTRSPGGTIFTTNLSRRVTVLPGPPLTDTGEPLLPGTGAEGAGGPATGCGVLGFLPLLFGMGSLLWLRRQRF